MFTLKINSSVSESTLASHNDGKLIRALVTATGNEQYPVHNQIGAAIVDACVRAGKEGRKFRVIIVIPAIPGFAGDLRDDAAKGTRAIMDYQYKSINRGEHSIKERIRAAGIDPDGRTFFHFVQPSTAMNELANDVINRPCFCL